MISVEDVVKYSDMLLSEIDSHKLDVTYFEIVTMMAFMYYRDNRVDVAALECGLGGRLDATNICNSKVAVISSIGLDHCEILGNTTEQILREKCGIIRNGVTEVVIGPTVDFEQVD
jgi:dihydrofolate synthase/folylpolyglutamate synthase